MSYFEKSKIQGEELIRIFSLSKIHFTFRLLNILISVLISYILFKVIINWYDGNLKDFNVYSPYVKKAFYVFFVVYVVFYMIYLIIRYITTEIVVSNKRFIVKSGWISRSVSEVSISRIEGVSLKQGIVGRLFRYGSVIVRGTGGNLIVVPIVHDPMALQSTLQNMISAYGSKS